MIYPHHDLLAMPRDYKLRQAVRRTESIREAVAWEKGTHLDRRYYTVYRGGQWEVRLGKPGKEARRRTNTNPNDMLPCVFRDGQQLTYMPTFTDILKNFLRIHQANPECVRLVGYLLLRAVYMVDHEDIGLRQWRYCPSVDILDGIESVVPETVGMPTRVFLQLVDAIAWNEDVKYWTKSPQKKLADVGRPNNLLTYVCYISMLLEAIDPADMVGAVASGHGVARLTKDMLSKAMVAFPYADMAQQTVAEASLFAEG